MQQYKNKKELIANIIRTYELFVLEFEEVNNEYINKRIDCIDKTPLEMITYQIGWLNTIMMWDREEYLGNEVITPSPGIKWNELGKLHQQFYTIYKEDTIEKLLSNFDAVKIEFIKWIESLDEKTLFEENRRRWAITNSKWAVWKWIHINSVAPFKSFRTKIRKWKKYK